MLNINKSKNPHNEGDRVGNNHDPDDGTFANTKAKPYTEVVVENWREAKEILTNLGGNWIFRGQSNAAWELQTGFEREITPAILPPGSLGMGAAINFPPRYEEQMVEEFQRGAHLYIKGGRLPEHMLDWLALMQHYGVPTRLLDFTKSPYVACYFAFRNMNNAPHRAVWALNPAPFTAEGENQWRLNTGLREAVLGSVEENLWIMG